MKPIAYWLSKLRTYKKHHHCTQCGRRLYSKKAMTDGMGRVCASKVSAHLAAERAGQLRLFE